MFPVKVPVAFLIKLFYVDLFQVAVDGRITYLSVSVSRIFFKLLVFYLSNLNPVVGKAVYGLAELGKNDTMKKWKLIKMLFVLFPIL